MPGRSTGSYLALGCIGHSPNCSDHGEGAGRLVGVLLPRDRVIGERPITAEGNRRQSSGSADNSDETCPITPQCSAAPSQAEAVLDPLGPAQRPEQVWLAW